MKPIKRKCVKVLDGNTFEIDKPIEGEIVIQLEGVEKGDEKQKEKLIELIEGKEVDIYPKLLIRDF